jgi:hypothetical protein
MIIHRDTHERPRWGFLAVMWLLVAFILLFPMGCSANPLATAAKATPENRPETVAFALTASYTVLAEHAVKLAEDSTTPRAVRRALVNLHQTAAPAVKRLRALAVEYKGVREAYESGRSTPEKIAVTLAKLDSAITSTAPLVQAMATEISSAH